MYTIIMMYWTVTYVHHYHDVLYCTLYTLSSWCTTFFLTCCTFCTQATTVCTEINVMWVGPCTALEVLKVQYITVQYCTVLSCTLQYYTLQYCTLQYCTLNFCAVYCTEDIQVLFVRFSQAGYSVYLTVHTVLCNDAYTVQYNLQCVG